MAILVTGLLLPAARSGRALEECPSIQPSADGDRLPASLTGSRDCDASVCDEGAGSFVQDALAGICEVFPSVSCAFCDCCRTPAPSLFTGADSELFDPGAPLTGCAIGGLGRTRGEVALCLLRDLGNPAQPPSVAGQRGINLESNRIDLGIGDAFLEQHIGLRDFDPVGRRMRGFHTIGITVPVLGRITGLTQGFTAELVAGDRVPFSKLFTPLCNGRLLTEPWSLDIEADDVQHRIGFDVGPFTIPTPVGEIAITPRFDYESNLQVGNRPPPLFRPTTRSFPDCGGSSYRTRLYGTEGGDLGLTNSFLAIYEINRAPTELSRGWGWESLVTLGGRGPEPDAAPWMPASDDEAPMRPDFDFNQARTDVEKRPSTRFHAGVNLSYGLEQLLSFINFPPLSVTRARVFVISDLDASFSSQFQLSTAEGRGNGLLPPDCRGTLPPIYQPSVEFQSAAEAFAGFGVDAGFDIRLKLDLGLFVKRFKIAKTFDVFSAPPEGTNRAPVLSSRATLGSGDVMPFRAGAGPVPDDAFIDECFVQPPPAPSTPPAPAIAPGDPTDLFDETLFPCNVCLFLPRTITGACVPEEDDLEDDETIICGEPSVNGMPCDTSGRCEQRTLPDPVTLERPLQQKLVPASQADLDPSLRWSCDAVEKLGCADLCRWVPDATEPLQVVRSAVENDGAHCRDVPPGGVLGAPACTVSAECDDGNPCTLDACEINRCVNLELDGGSCDNGSFCDGADLCEAGTCVGTTNPCVASGEACNEGTDSCQASSVARGVCDDLAAGDPCDDQSACTTGDRCVDGTFGRACRGEPALDCDDGDPGTVDSCEDVDGTPLCVNADPSALGECGDDDRQPGEQCDGTDAGLCPGACRADCTCPAEDCGNGMDDDGNGQIDCADALCESAGCQCRPIGRDPGSIRPGPAPGQDRLGLHGTIEPCTPFDATVDAVQIVLSSAGGTIYEATVPPGSFERTNAKKVRFRDRDARRARSGVSKLVIRQQTRRGLFDFEVEAFGDLAGATEMMTFQIRIGDQSWVNRGTWVESRGRWQLKLPGER